MSQAKTDFEAGMPTKKAAQASGSPDTTITVKDTLPEGMKSPSAPGEQSMGGQSKSDGHIGNAGLGAAVSLLNKQTERGAHAPKVGSY